MTPALVIRGRQVVLPGAIGPATVHICDGVITTISVFDDVPPGAALHDAGDHVVMPGLVDTHVHINEPGRTHWEGFETATRAAAGGGVTTLIEMPLNSIPATTSVPSFEEKLAAALGKLHVDVGFWGGVVPGNTAEMRGLADAGVWGFKCFLVPSGVDEFPPVGEADLRQALPPLAETGMTLLVHAELPGPIDCATAKATKSTASTQYSAWLASRPRQAENEAIALLVRLAREFGVHIHVVHLSSSDALPILREAKQRGLPVTVETCPHFLTFAAEDIPDGATQYKCAPPIRERSNREKLWAALGEGLIDLVATDHSPCPPEIKCGGTGDFMKAWGGISSLQLGLPVMWTQLRQRGYSIGRLVEWMCRAPARLAGLARRKGSIAVGYDADLVVWNPEESFQVVPSQLHHRHKLTPYAGHTLYGVVEATFVRGKQCYASGEFSSAPTGSILLRGRT